MKSIKRICALVLALVLSAMAIDTAYAHEAPDVGRVGSISVTMTYDGAPVPGGSLMLYRVGEISESDGNYQFVLTEDFAASGASLEHASSEVAANLTQFASAEGRMGTTAEIGGNGRASVGALTPGMYLVVQIRAADGYEAITPFLVSVPVYEDGRYVYDVDASPKMSTLTKTPTVTPTPAAPATPDSPTLPQTGQLNWPVPVLAGLGLCLFLLGWVLRFGKRGKIL